MIWFLKFWATFSQQRIIERRKGPLFKKNKRKDKIYNKNRGIKIIAVRRGMRLEKRTRREYYRYK